MKDLISKGLTIEQLEERMEFTTLGLSSEELAAAHDAGYSDDEIFRKPPNCSCPHQTYFRIGGYER
jgi:hypothetical protein